MPTTKKYYKVTNYNWLFGCDFINVFYNNNNKKTFFCWWLLNVNAHVSHVYEIAQLQEEKKSIIKRS